MKMKNQDNSIEIDKDITEEDFATDFLNWCRSRILDKSIVINEVESSIHKVISEGEQVLAVLTPAIFFKYAESIGMSNPVDKRTFTQIQSAIHKAKLNIPSSKGQIHFYTIKKSSNNPMARNIKISCYLFSVDAFCGENEEIKKVIEQSELTPFNLIKFNGI